MHTLTLRRVTRAGVLLAAGSAVPSRAWGAGALHREMEELVRSGLSPLEAITAATGAAACALGAEQEVGTLKAGKLADLVLLDADPLRDIRHTRKIRQVIQGGKVVDREGLMRTIR